MNLTIVTSNLDKYNEITNLLLYLLIDKFGPTDSLSIPEIQSESIVLLNISINM
jgi:hypothetical protein